MLLKHVQFTYRTTISTISIRVIVWEHTTEAGSVHLPCHNFHKLHLNAESEHVHRNWFNSLNVSQYPKAQAVCKLLTY